jgi:hypothetical protein
MIPLVRAKASYERAAKLVNYKFVERPGLGHWVDGAEMAEMRGFIRGLL